MISPTDPEDHHCVYGKAVVVGGPAVALDIFSPVREDYAKLFNKYVGDSDAETD